MSGSGYSGYGYGCVCGSGYGYPISPVTDSVGCAAHGGEGQDSYSFWQLDLATLLKHGAESTFRRDMVRLLEWACVDCRLVPAGLDLQVDKSLCLADTFVGHGSVSYVYPLVGTALVVKFPTTRRKFGIIVKEALVLAYLHRGMDPSVHVVPLVGVSYLNRMHYQKLKSSERIPGLLLPRFDVTLQTYYTNFALTRDNWWELAAQMAAVLRHLRDKKIVHSDIKTANILVDTARNAFYLADFTSAFIADSTANNSGQLAVNSTMEYCPPELLSSSSASPATSTISYYQADLYSMALCLLSYITKCEPYSKVKLLKFEGESNRSSFEKSQWLLNVILQNDPIKFNLQYDDQLVSLQDWHSEIDLISKLLIDRISLDDYLLRLNSSSP